MRSILTGAALLALAAPAMAESAPTAAAPAAAPPAAAAPATDKDASTKRKADNFDIGQMMAVFDKIFPAQPDPLPARLALARTAVNGLLPDGTYGRMMGGMMRGVIDRVMGLTDADFGKKDVKGKPAETMTLRQKMAKDDPHFEERMRITQRVLGEEFGKMAAIIEPRIRDGLARSIARRFDENQLADINAFLATDSGRAFGGQSMAMWVDSDVMRSVMTSFPEMMKAMPAAMKRVETETAHLPKPKKTPKPKSTS